MRLLFSRLRAFERGRSTESWLSGIDPAAVRAGPPPAGAAAPARVHGSAMV
jgi:hypothetical protein